MINQSFVNLPFDEEKNNYYMVTLIFSTTR